MQDDRRALPSVERLLQTEPLRSAAEQGTRSLAVAAARSELEQCRTAIMAGNGAPAAEEIATRAAHAMQQADNPSLGPVINATGVVVHTNLGRAPLAFEALEAIDRAASGYSDLEYDLGTGARGSRQAHVEPLVRELTGAPAAMVVNNNAAAVLLALAALARDREVVISRGQLVEIGGSFRIPEILAASGARLVEVGTTNRTRIEDYERAIGPDTAALMRVHASNFRTVGFTEEASLPDLAALARFKGLLLIDDLGSGVLSRRDGALEAVLQDEPAARTSVEAGADVVCCSADKLLGGPQAGIVAGSEAAIARMRAHPLARAVRIDKLSLAALEATLRLHRDPDRAVREIPVLQMLIAPRTELQDRAGRLRDGIAAALPAETAKVQVVPASGRAGGGALPLLELEGPAVAVASPTIGPGELQARLRAGDPPIVTRVRDDTVLLDPRTIAEVEVDFVVRGVIAALS
jgi:L-seryl-tRNA(Ser) seleniumtransferase